MYLIFDVSGTEKPKEYKANFSDIHLWPKLVHVSWILLDKDLKPMEDFDYIVRKEDRAYSKAVMNFAKIDEEDIEKKGKPIEEILLKFNESLDKCQYLIAHNKNINANILAAEYLRNTIEIKHFKKEPICIMQEGTYITKLPTKYGTFKWPSLVELHAALFNSTFTPPNNARADVIAAARCFIKMMKSGHLEDFFEE
jgi:DNA polymerase III epsilon subunit-like protein